MKEKASSSRACNGSAPASRSTLSWRLSSRENELAILEGLLADEEYQEAVALEGRPVKWGWLSSPYGVIRDSHGRRTL